MCVALNELKLSWSVDRIVPLLVKVAPFKSIALLSFVWLFTIIVPLFSTLAFAPLFSIFIPLLRLFAVILIVPVFNMF